MNRFNSYYSAETQKSRVQIDSGVFELRKTAFDDSYEHPELELVFIDGKSGKETVVENRVLNIAPFGKSGIACNMTWLTDDGKIRLAFYEYGKVVFYDAYINADNVIYYLNGSGIYRACYMQEAELMLSKDELEKLGYKDSINLEDDCFSLPSGKKEYVGLNFFDYSGHPLYSVKQQRTAKCIMKDFDIMLTSWRSRQNDNEKTDEFIENVKNVEIADIKKFIRYKKRCGNLDKKRVKPIYSVIKTLKQVKKEQFFGRYIEFIVTAGEQIGLTKRDFVTDISSVISMHRRLFYGMDIILCKLVKRDDFSYLLCDYDAFENVISNLLEDEII